MADPETAPDPSAAAGRRRGRGQRPGATADAWRHGPDRPRRSRLGDGRGIRITARAGSDPGPPSFGGYSGRTEKGGCDPRSGDVASGSGEPAGVFTTCMQLRVPAAPRDARRLGDGERPDDQLRAQHDPSGGERVSAVPSPIAHDVETSGSPKLARQGRAVYFFVVAAVTAAVSLPLLSRLSPHTPSSTTFFAYSPRAPRSPRCSRCSRRGRQSYHATSVFLIPGAILVLKPELVALIPLGDAPSAVAQGEQRLVRVVLQHLQLHA